MEKGRARACEREKEKRRWMDSGGKGRGKAKKKKKEEGNVISCWEEKKKGGPFKCGTHRHAREILLLVSAERERSGGHARNPSDLAPVTRKESKSKQ